MTLRSRKKQNRRVRSQFERLEDRTLLSNLIEGRGPGENAGFAAAAIGPLLDTQGLVDDFAVSAPFADTGEVYVVFGDPALNSQANEGCVARDPRVDGCEFIQTLLTRQGAVLIRGENSDDLFGYSVAGVGDVVGNELPDLVVGAPNAGPNNEGRVYLVPGDLIQDRVIAARTAGGNIVATIDLSIAADLALVDTFTGPNTADEYGSSVSGLGFRSWAVGAPGFDNGTTGNAGRVDIYIGTNLVSILNGPSAGANLGGVPFAEFNVSGVKGASVTGVRNTGLVPVVDQGDSELFSILGGTRPEVIVGAPNACFNENEPANYTCTPDSIRPGLGYVLSGDLLVVNRAVPQTFSLGVDADLKLLDAIVVRGDGDGDLFAGTVSGAGDLDGDIPDGGSSDIMFGAARRDTPGAGAASTSVDAGEVYVVFGREIVGTPFPDGACNGPSNNFRQCRDNNGNVIPLNAGDFERNDRLVGLIFRGSQAGEHAGMSLSEAGNFIDPSGRQSLGQSSQVGVSDIMIGAPKHDITNGTDAGRAYIVIGDTDYDDVFGIFRNLGQIDDLRLGIVLDGTQIRDSYGISVAGIGNAADPPATVGDDVLIGAHLAQVSFSGVVENAVGEAEIFFGNSGSALGLLGGNDPLFIQPGPFGPQIFVPGYWSFTPELPPAGSVVDFPLQASVPINISTSFFPVPPFNASSGVFQPGVIDAAGRLPGGVGPFATTNPLGAALFISDEPMAHVDGAGNLNVVDENTGPSGFNLTTAMNSPKLQSGATTLTSGKSVDDVYGLDRKGRVIHHWTDGFSWFAHDVSGASGAPRIVGEVSVDTQNTRAGRIHVIVGRSKGGQLIQISGSEELGWSSERVSKIKIESDPKILIQQRGARVVEYIYAVDRRGHLREFWQQGRRSGVRDLSARLKTARLSDELAANLRVARNGRVTGRDIYVATKQGQLAHLYTVGNKWRRENISAKDRIIGDILSSDSVHGPQQVYAQTNRGLIELTQSRRGWKRDLISGKRQPNVDLVATGGNANRRALLTVRPNGGLAEFQLFNGKWREYNFRI